MQVAWEYQGELQPLIGAASRTGGTGVFDSYSRHEFSTSNSGFLLVRSCQATRQTCGKAGYTRAS